mmetsp:Transcript_12365/g.28532  ORF Transcript_12365/g.28532 Transcript_12365/m.28532 type:complete len:248 (+) Transcript_12365:604-1347(+)
MRRTLQLWPRERNGSTHGLPGTLEKLHIPILVFMDLTVSIGTWRATMIPSRLTTFFPTRCSSSSDPCPWPPNGMVSSSLLCHLKATSMCPLLALIGPFCTRTKTTTRSFTTTGTMRTPCSWLNSVQRALGCQRLTLLISSCMRVGPERTRPSTAKVKPRRTILLGGYRLLYLVTGPSILPLTPRSVCLRKRSLSRRTSSSSASQWEWGTENPFSYSRKRLAGRSRHFPPTRGPEGLCSGTWKLMAGS